MAKYSNQVVYDIKTNIDTSGLKKLQTELSNLKQTMSKGFGGNRWGIDDKELEKSIHQVERLQSLFNKGFDATTGTYNIKKINSLLNTTYKDVQNCTTGWTRFGLQGQQALTTLATTLTQIQKQTTNLNTLFGKMGTTMANTIRWGISATVFQGFTSEISKAVNYMKDLDESLTNIQMVTSSSKEDMRELAQYANKAAQALGSTTTDYTNAVKVFVQEGFSEKESKQYANLSTKMANISEQNTATTSDQITAYRNAFQLDYEQTVEAMDKVANVANNTASNVNELMTASQRSAAVAQAVGASQESFLASIATIESVTRQSAEEIGNGLKTIYQRFADIKVSGKTEDGVDYGQYANALKTIGVDVLDATGEFKGMEQIFSELQEVWSTLSETMKVAVGEKVAGKFQYARFAALMNNQDYYNKAYEATQDSSGMVDQMNEYYMESIEGKMKTLQSAGEQIITSLFDQDNVEPMIDAVTDVFNGIDNIVEALGGLQGVLIALSPLIWKVFGSQISAGITSMASNIVSLVAGGNKLKETMSTLGLSGLTEKSKTVGFLQQATGFEGMISEKSYKETLTYVQQIGEAEQKIYATLDKTKTILQNQRSLLAEKTEAIQKNKDIQQQENDKLIEENEKINEEISLLRKRRRIEYENTEELSKQIHNLTQRRAENKQIIQDGEQYLQTLNQQKDALIQAEKVSKDLVTEIEKGTLSYEQITKEIERYRELLSQAGLSTQQIDNEVSILKEQMNQVAFNTDLFKNKLKSISVEAIITGVGKIVSGLTSALMSLQMFKEAGEQFKEGDYFGGTLSVLMGVSMVLPLISSAVKIFRTETIVATAAQWGLNIAMSSNPVGAVLLAITALVAILGGLVAITYTMTEAAHKANKEFEKQKEILTETKQHYKDVKEEVDSLKTSLDTIKDTKASLEGMVKGTEEWYEATSKLNDQVLELLDTYPELANYLNTDNGYFDIDDKALESLYRKRANQANVQKDSVRLQEANTLQAENAKLIEDFSNEHGISKEEVEEAIKNSAETLNNNPEQAELYSELIKAIEANNVKTEKLTEKLGVPNILFGEVASDNQLDKNYKGKATKEFEEIWNNSSNTDSTKTSFSSKSFSERRMFNSNDNDNSEEIAKYLQENLFANEKIKKVEKHGDKVKIIFEDENKEALEKSFNELSQQLKNDADIADKQEQRTDIAKNIAKSWGLEYDEDLLGFVKIGDTSKTVINSLSELSDVTEEQVAIMEKLNDSSYSDYMSTLYGGVEKFSEMIAKGQYNKDNTFADREAGFEAFTESQRLEGLYGDQYQSIIESLKSNLGFVSPETLKEYNNFETLEDFTKAIKNNIISLDGLSEALDKLKNEQVDLTKNINGNEFTNRIDISSDEEKFKDFLNDSGMSQGAFNRMSRDTYEEENGYFQVNKERLEDNIEKQKEFISHLHEGSRAFDEAQEELVGMESELADLGDASKDTTAYILRMSNGVVKLRNKIEDISEILTNEAARGTTEWYEALTDLDEGLSEVLNIDAGTLSDSFIESGDALDYARRMAEGDMTAIDDLRRAASEDIIQNLTIQPKEGQSVEDIRKQLLTELNQLQAEIDSGAITVTTDLDTKPFINRLNEMLEKGQISAEQASNILSSIGMDAKLDYVEGNGTIPAIAYKIGWVDGLPGFEPVSTDIPAKVKFPVIRGAHYTGSGVQTASTAASNPSYAGGYSNNPKPSSSSSPKSSTPKETKSKNNQKKEKPAKEWDYLTDITNDLDRASAAMEKLTKLEDRLYGASRVSQLKKLQGEYKNYIKLLDKEVKLAKGHAKRLQNNAYDENGNLTMNGYAYRAGIGSLQFDAQGNLQNGKAISDALYQKLMDAKNNYDTHRNDDNSDWYDHQFQLAQKDYEGFTKAMSEYESTLSKIEDGQNQIQDYKEKIQDAADAIIDAIQQGIEDAIKAIDNQRDFNKMYQDWQQGGSSYSHFGNDRKYYEEGLQGLLSPTSNGKSIFDMQKQNLKDRIKDAKNVFDGNSKNADDEKLSEQAAFENLQNATENIMDTLNKITSYYDSLLTTIQEASAKMDELIDNRLEQFTDLEDYLDTRLDQFQLIFGDKSYEQQIQFYQQKNLVYTEKMATISAAIEAKQATVAQLEKLEASGKKLSTEERKELQDARNKVNELQKELINTETKYLQTIANELRDKTSAAMNDLTKQLFGGADLDWLSQQWEMATRNSTKYLDDYNRAFEVQKLQLKFQKALNDSQNMSFGIQKRINALADEYLTYLREKDNLSEYDVKHAQMQLDILQKRIALEEAQNNKSQMRLQRNAAGNYDFVYAADEDQVNNAMQELLAMEQESYNLSKQHFLEIYQSAYETALKTKDMIIEIATDASITLEDRRKRIQEIMDGLNEYLQGSSVELGEISINLYNSFVDAEESISEINQGKLTETFNNMRKNSISLKEFLAEDVSVITQNINDKAGTLQASLNSKIDEFEQYLSDKNGKIKENTTDTISNIGTKATDATSNIKDDVDNKFGLIEERVGAFVKNSADGFNKIKVDANREYDEIQNYIDKTVLAGIDERFDISVNNSLDGVNTIDRLINETTNKIINPNNGYLAEFEQATIDCLAQAGDAYETFASDCIDYASQRLENLRTTTQDWQGDLTELNGEIGSCATAMGIWKGSIDKVYKALYGEKKNGSDGLIKQADDLQVKIGLNADKAYEADSNFWGLAGAADAVASSVDSMYNTINSSYDSLGDAANAARDAFNDMRESAEEAEAAAREAINAWDNVPRGEWIVSDSNGVYGSVGGFKTEDAAWSYASSANLPYDNVYVYYREFATGGYTGTWNDKGIDDKNGKLAILHQKELVLNATDTENMLSAVEVVRDIMSNINSLPSIGKNINQNNFSNDTIEQRVEINATFPGVTEAIEIKQALEQLADNAYQVASRYR